MSYDRVLPRPVPGDASQVSLPRRSNDLLDYKIMNDGGATKLSPVNWPIEGELSMYTAQRPATGPAQVPFESDMTSLIKRTIDFDHAVASPKFMVPALAKNLPVRTRSSLIRKSSSSKPVKLAAPKESVVQSCLCQTGRNIPRPKNGKTLPIIKHGRRADGKQAAFFLYRQHYQATAVAQNPGLGNAHISRIIGAQWRMLPEEMKNIWHANANKKLAISSVTQTTSTGPFGMAARAIVVRTDSAPAKTLRPLRSATVVVEER
ncbi:hypothetical protein Asppvi_003791 [Aspergillus pseudoviridinutans]|uniref:HMG box domain-containing protein n=1 Tax=Aspergillus pseudoviridinutans TaxID=1517512 RepID=A0A9P3BC02_9EURO|nr:uncharacterized protein Asppvi_003791 [Aspergillus pseudoviridinutans]GIJ84936.1 hypothetical protein Asppvi_003791 [Aspergillus pseudoviridinutans]